MDLGHKWLDKLFVVNPKLFKDMVVEFVKFGGKGLDLGGNWLYEIFAGKPELFKDMVVEFVELGGKWLDLRWNDLTQILNSAIEVEWTITRKTVREITEETRKTYWVIIDLYN